MCNKLSKFWSELDVTVAVNKRELVLGIAACTLAGLVAGMLCSPRKNITAGCNNGSNNVVTKPAPEASEEEAEE
ncbi:MAG: hypothetical protein Q4F17_10675 [Eubacteriales bacterium]|nr:hypothetical protein [Eubacteriales bacterium]